jgi:hypothetical protein
VEGQEVVGVHGQAGMDSETISAYGGSFIMAECEFCPGCLFFNDKMAKMPLMAEMLKRKYCKGDFEKCARRMIAKSKGRDKVPNDMSPSQIDRAKLLLQ